LGWRLPTLNELYRPFRVGADATAANELLSPERLKGAELGFDYNGPIATLSGSLFVSRLDGAIANVTKGNGPGTFAGVGFVAAGGTYRKRENLNAIDSKGIELSGSIRVGDQFEINADYAYVDARVKDTVAPGALGGLRPAQIAPHSANISVEFNNEDFTVATSLNYVSSQFEDDSNRLSLKDALTLDAAASYDIGDNLRVILRAENLLDTEVQAGISGAGIIERAAPRSVSIGFSWGY
jgi:vitamin B12 transporter